MRRAALPALVLAAALALTTVSGAGRPVADLQVKGTSGPQSTADDQAGILLAARQNLVNYATQEGLEILRNKLTTLAIPDLAQTFNLPLVGDFTLQLSSIRVESFNLSMDDTRVDIMDGHFQLWVTQVAANLTFRWHWEKLGMTGTGSGELDLSGGSIDYKFRVASGPGGTPQLLVDDDASRFDSVSLKIKSFSSDWLYQAVMALFNNQIQGAVQKGISNALENDVPARLNQVLATLPTSLDIKGLPFSIGFEYSIFTLTYVLVKGYGLVESPEALAARVAAAGRVAAAAPLADTALERCPFAATPLPLSPAAIAADGAMASIYLHESVVNCVLWGLFRAGTLSYSLHDGSIPNLHVTTDLLGMLIPALPKTYPHQLVRLDVEAVAQPRVSFSKAAGTTLQASYRTSIYVANETLGTPKVVTMVANLTVVADVNYDTTIIKSVVAHHAVEEAVLPVNPLQWDGTIGWFVSNYAGLLPLSAAVQKFVKTPVASAVALVNTAATTDDAWYMLSGDVRLLIGAAQGTA